jgi:glycosyltransferase involved in cell wall biosynthesis
MRILIISELYPPHGKGAQIATKRLAESLASEHAVYVITNKFNDEKEYDIINKVTILRKPLFPNNIYMLGYNSYINLFASKIADAISDEIRTIDPDVAYVADLWFNIIPLLKGKYGLPVISHVWSYAPICYYVSTAKYYNYSTICSECKLNLCILHNNLNKDNLKATKGIIKVVFTPVEMLYAPWKISTMLKSLAYADAIVFPSDYAAEHFMRFIPSDMYFKIHDKTWIIPPILKDQGYIPYEGPNDVFSLIYMGGLDISKGYLNLIKVAMYIKEKDIENIQIFMAPTYSYEFMEFIKKHNLDYIVHPLPWLEYNQLVNLFKRIDALIAPSLWPETFLQVAVEANLTGSVAIVPYVGAPKDYIIEGVNGFFINSFNPLAITKKLIMISKIPKEVLLERGIYARQLALKLYNPENVINSYIKLLNTVVNQE